MSAIARNSVACEMDRRRRAALPGPATTRLASAGCAASRRCVTRVGRRRGGRLRRGRARGPLPHRRDGAGQLARPQSLGWPETGPTPGASAVEVLVQSRPRRRLGAAPSPCACACASTGAHLPRRHGPGVRTELAPLRAGRCARTAPCCGTASGSRVSASSRARLTCVAHHRLWRTGPGGPGAGTDPLYAHPGARGLKAGADVLVFFENTHDATVTIDDPSVTCGTAYAELASARHAPHYVSTGPLPELLRRYPALTGPPRCPRAGARLPPVPVGRTERVRTSASGGGFAAEGLPLSAVHSTSTTCAGTASSSTRALPRSRRPLAAGASPHAGPRVVTIVDPAIREDPDYDV